MSNREPIIFTSQGQKIYGMLHHPKGAGPFPGLLICPGYGSCKVGSYRIYVELAEMLAANGIASLRFDFRGTGDSEGWLHEITVEDKINDALAAYEYLQQRTEIDPDNMSVLGRSFGAVIAIELTRRLRNKHKGLVLWSPVCTAEQWVEEWKEYLLKFPDEKTIPFNGYLAGRRFFEEFLILDLMKELSLLDKLPCFFAFAGKEDVLDPRHELMYRQTREQASAETIYYEMPQSNHSFTPIDERTGLIQETAEWLIRLLYSSKLNSWLSESLLTQV